MGKSLNLNDFNTGSENILSSDTKGDNVKTKAVKIKKKILKENLTAKLQVGLTEAEYNKLYNDFEKSGFPSFAGYIRMKLKEIKFI